LEFSLSSLVHNIPSIAWAVFAMLAARAISVYGLIGLTNRFAARISGPWQHVMFWGGLRGSLSLALVLSLPSQVSDRSLMITMVFGTVIFSLLGQGLSITPLLNKLKLARENSEQDEYETLHGESLLESAAVAELARLRAEGIITERLYRQVSERLSRSQEELNAHLAKLDPSVNNIERDQLSRIQRHLLAVRKLRLSQLSREGMITDSTYRLLNQRLDERLVEIECEFRQPTNSQPAE
jgi:CPA1 family monovalent cation:H+ antiporter